MIVKKKEAQNITQLLKELFKTHGFESEEYEGWIIPKGTDYAMKGYWYPEATQTTGQLTIEVFVNSEIIMVESFAGIGESDNEKLKSAFSSFVYHDFPTLLLSIWSKESDEVLIEQWKIGEHNYRVYLGKKGIINYDKEKELTIPESYYSKIKTLISNEPLDKEMYWFTFFYANLNGLDNYAEVLQENIKKVSFSDALKTLNWKRSNHYYAVRQFLVLKKL